MRTDGEGGELELGEARDGRRCRWTRRHPRRVVVAVRVSEEEEGAARGRDAVEGRRGAKERARPKVDLARSSSSFSLSPLHHPSSRFFFLAFDFTASLDTSPRHRTRPRLRPAARCRRLAPRSFSRLANSTLLCSNEHSTAAMAW